MKQCLCEYAICCDIVVLWPQEEVLVVQGATT
jgi:hypothetical protein